MTDAKPETPNPNAPKKGHDKVFDLIEMLYWYKRNYPNWGKVHKALETKINNDLGIG